MRVRNMWGGSLLFAISITALAQEEAPPPETTPETAPAVAPAVAADDQEGLAEVVVTAQRREERAHDVPLTIAAMSSEQLAESGVTNIFDLQNVVSGLSWGGAGNATQTSIRGLSTLVSTNGSENPNALYVDGVYYSQAQLLGANLPDVERIEVLKGPQGTLFGRNSVGGALRIFTRNPTFERTGDATVETGFYTGDGESRASPHYTARGYFSTPLVDQTLAASVSGGYDWTEGFLTNQATGDEYGEIRRANARGKLLWQPSENVQAVFGAFYLKHNDTGLQAMTPYHGWVLASTYPGSVVPTEPFHTAYDSGNGYDFDRAEVQSHGFTAHVNADLGDYGALSSISAWTDSEADNLTTLNHSQGSAACIAAFACVDYAYRLYTKALSQELNYVSKRIGIVSFTSGLFFYQQRQGTDTDAQRTLYAAGYSHRSVRFDTESYAAYGEANVAATERLTVVLGARYTYEPHDDRSLLSTPPIHREETFTSFIPRISLKYDINKQLNAYATYSVGEKSGLSGVDNPGSTPAYARIDPEENDAYEVGLKYAASRLTANLSLFYYDYKNKQEQGFTGTDVFLQNTGPVRLYGLDFDGSWRLHRDWTLRTALTWLPEDEYRDFKDALAYRPELADDGSFTGVEQTTFDATGYRLPRAAEFMGNASLLYSHPVGADLVDASANYNYTTKVYQDIYHVIEQPAYGTLSARAGYLFARSGLRLGVYGRNLTNETYIAHAFASGQGFTAAYARPREIGLELNYSF
ncbi:MAG: TonB-dependent receptor [Solimonas sp.]